MIFLRVFHTALGEEWYLCVSSGALGDEGPRFLIGFNGVGVEGVLVSTALRYTGGKRNKDMLCLHQQG